jgi:hypothetical protein
VNAAGKLAGFAVVLGAVLGGGAAVGSAVGPIDVANDDTDGHGGHASGETGDTSATDAEVDLEATLPAGLMVSQAGYTLVPDGVVLDGMEGAPFRFRITGPDGTALEDFEPEQERELHLVVVSRDLTTYAHLHPTRSADGTWSVPMPALTAGAYRAFADFTVADGPDLTLGVDLTVPGDTRFGPLLPPATTADAGDGYEVALAGEPAAGADTEVALTVRRDGVPVDDLEPYLGADGHLVAIRAGDLAYLHVHPLDGTGAGGRADVRFQVEVPSPGDYRLFFEFAHDGGIRTAAFTIHVPAAGEPTGPGGSPPSESHGGHDPTEEES